MLIITISHESATILSSLLFGNIMTMDANICIVAQLGVISTKYHWVE